MFEKSHGQCAVVLLDSQSCRILYLHKQRIEPDQTFFPPGSLMKPMSAAILCSGDSVDISFGSRFYCKGKFFPDTVHGFDYKDKALFNLADDAEGKYFPCSVGKGHGMVSMRDALIHSCNFFFLSAAQKDPLFYEHLVKIWKLDDLLLPGQQYNETSYNTKDITPFQKISAAIGEGNGVLLSPVKIAENYAALFENTPLLEPFEGEGERKIRHDLPVGEPVRQMIRSALSGTITEGTLFRLNTNAASCRVLAGKTGTSTDLKDKKNHHGWNALWIEKDGHRFILVTFVFHGRGSGEAADLSSVILGAL